MFFYIFLLFCRNPLGGSFGFHEKWIVDKKEKVDSRNPLGGSFGFHKASSKEEAIEKLKSQSPWRVFWFPH